MHKPLGLENIMGAKLALYAFILSKTLSDGI